MVSSYDNRQHDLKLTVTENEVQEIAKTLRLEKTVDDLVGKSVKCYNNGGTGDIEYGIYSISSWRYKKLMKKFNEQQVICAIKEYLYQHSSESFFLMFKKLEPFTFSTSAPMFIPLLTTEKLLWLSLSKK